MFPALDIAKWAGLLSIIGGLYTHGYMSGKDSVQAEWDKERAEFAITDLEQAMENRDLIEKLEGTKRENLKTIDTLHADLAKFRVQVPVRRCAAKDSQPSTTTGSTDEATGSGELSDGLQTAFDDFTKSMADSALKADEVVEGCRVLRDWAAGLK